MQETWAQSLGWKVPLEKGMATHSSLLAWRISWIKGTGRLQWNTTEQLTLLPSGYRLLRWYLCIIVGFIASALEHSNILLYFMNQYKDEMASAIKISHSKKNGSCMWIWVHSSSTTLNLFGRTVCQLTDLTPRPDDLIWTSVRKCIKHPSHFRRT